MIGKRVIHFKGVNAKGESMIYLVIGLALHTEIEEPLVIYKALYGEGKIYARPKSMFMSEVPAGKENPTLQKYRFELL